MLTGKANRVALDTDSETVHRCWHDNGRDTVTAACGQSLAVDDLLDCRLTKDLSDEHDACRNYLLTIVDGDGDAWEELADDNGRPSGQFRFTQSPDEPPEYRTVYRLDQIIRNYGLSDVY